MKRVIGLIFVLGLTLGLAAGRYATDGSHVVLPNPKLLRCKTSDCFPLWLGESAQGNGVFPKQVIVDVNKDCIYGLTASYDKSVPIDEIKSAIDGRYGKWATPESVDTPLKLWRVEPEKFAIHLSTAGREDERKNLAEAGTKQVIYIAFGGRSACNVP